MLYSERNLTKIFSFSYSIFSSTLFLRLSRNAPLNVFTQGAPILFRTHQNVIINTNIFICFDYPSLLKRSVTLNRQRRSLLHRERHVRLSLFVVIRTAPKTLKSPGPIRFTLITVKRSR